MKNSLNYAATALVAACSISAPAMAQDKEYYTTFSVGSGNFVQLDSTYGTINFDPGFTWDVGFGKYIGDKTRLELLYERQDSYGWKFWSVNVRDHTRADSAVLSYLYDFKNDSKWTPYIGPSIGTAWVSNGGETASSFAYGVQAGISYKIDNTKDLIFKLSHIRATRLDYAYTWITNGGYTSARVGIRF